MTNPITQEYFTKIKQATTKENAIALVEAYAAIKAEKSNKTFKNWLTQLNKMIETIENVPDELKSEYKGRVNHVAYSHSLTLGAEHEAFKRKLGLEPKPEQASEVTTRQRESVAKKPQAAKIATVLDAGKFINLAVKLIHSDDWRDIGIGLSMLTGLRQADTFFYTKIEAENEYSLLVTGISKKREDKQNYTYRVPVFYDSNEIERAYEKLRKIKPFYELHAIARESGLTEARAKFNNNYSSTILNRYEEVCREFLPSDDDNYHALRGCFTSIWFWLMDARKVSPKDALEFAKASIAHDSDSYVQRYLKIRFENLPTLPEEVFEMEYTEVKSESAPDKIISLNLTKLLQGLDISSQNDLSVMLQNQPNIETVLSNLIAKGLMQMKMQSGTSGKLQPTVSQKLMNIVAAVIKYNQNKQNGLKVCISTTMVQKLGVEILDKEIDRNTAKGVIESLSTEITNCHSAYNITEKTNLSLRGGDKMNTTITKIKDIYDTV